MSGPVPHEALSWRYGTAAPIWRSTRLQWSEGTLPDRVATLLAPLWDFRPLPPWWGLHPRGLDQRPQRRALVVEGWDE